MRIKSLLRDFIAAFPVVGPHADIETELMLAGKKKLTWMLVDVDDRPHNDWRMQKAHEDRKKLDEAVSQGKLIAMDVEYRYPDYPDQLNLVRHYAQPGNDKNLKMVTEFNKQAFNRQDLTNVQLNKNIGHYLGYRKRDIFFFKHIIQNDFLPSFFTNMIIELNAPFQAALREKLLEEAGYDPQKWVQDIPTPENNL